MRSASGWWVCLPPPEALGNRGDLEPGLWISSIPRAEGLEPDVPLVPGMLLSSTESGVILLRSSYS